MAKYKSYNYSQEVLIPVCLEEQRMPGTLEFAIHTLVDNKHQVIVYGEAFGDGQNHYHVPPLLDGAKGNMEAIGHSKDCLKEKILVADSNYYSPTNLNKCEDERLDAYIPDKNFRRRDPRFAAQRRWRPHRGKRFTGEDFHRDESTDEYVCAQGKRLKREVKQFVKDGRVFLDTESYFLLYFPSKKGVLIS